MNKTAEYFLDTARDIAEGRMPEESFYAYISRMPENEIEKLFQGADYLRQYFFDREIQLCAICNAKSGSCSEDCCFCAQSAHYPTQISIYPMQDEEVLREKGAQLSKTPVNRYSL